MASPQKKRWPRRWLRVFLQAKRHLFSTRNELIARLTIRLGLRANELCDLRFSDVDLSSGRLHCRGIGRTKTRSPELDDAELALVKTLLADRPEGGSEDNLLFVSRSGGALDRVDIWRVLRRLGHEAGLKTPLHTRRARRVLGHLTADSSRSDAIEVAACLGVHTLDAIDAYLPRRRPRRSERPAKQKDNGSKA